MADRTDGGSTAPRRHIIALGGGGFSMEPENHLLDLYVLRQSPGDRPRICFLATASGDSPEYIGRFYRAFAEHPCVPSHLSLFDPPVADIRKLILQQDIIYVGGGNTKSMLALWREWELDHIFREAWERGIVLAGISAGSICWFAWGLTDSIPGSLTPLPCLGFLPGSNCPHYNGEVERRPAYRQAVASGALADGYAADDGVALHFTGTELAGCVSSRPEARAYRVERMPDGDALETPITPVYLGPVEVQ
jgi:dipeptidase E